MIMDEDLKFWCGSCQEIETDHIWFELLKMGI